MGYSSSSSDSRLDSPTPLGSISKFNTTNPIYPTRCVHTISQEDNNSVLSLASSKKYLFSGSQSSKIHVWDLETFSLVKVLEGHRGSVLGLSLSPNHQWLFSCSGDGTVRVWDTETLKCAYLVQSCHDVGDIFSVVYSDRYDMFIFGSQNTSIQWYDFADPQTHGATTDVPVIPISLRSSQKSKFFDLDSDGYDKYNHDLDKDVIKCVIREKNVCMNAHDGYVYCLLHSTNMPNVDGEVIISGSGDGDVKVWAIENGGLKHLRTLTGNSDKGVLSLALSDDGYLFCGVQGGDVQIWDLETYQMIRSVMAHSDDVLAVSLQGPGLISASADGTVKIWSEGFEFREAMTDHEGFVLSMATSNDYLITGSSDHSIKFWSISVLSPVPEHFRRNSVTQSELTSDTLLYSLDRWVSMRTVSGNVKYMEECRRGARFLKNILQQLGAVSRMIPGATGRNPLVYGRFAGKRSSDEEGQDKKIPTVLIYGHYDVIAAENENDDWQTDPFKLTGKNGYLYGRGTSDNKGPILACIFAVNELLKEGLLDVNVILLIEGEEESGSVGFYDAVDQHKELFKDVDMILLSNSYWLGEDVPCLTYGLRGVMHASISISNTRADLHSGVEGGAVSEPLIDMIHVLGQLVDNNKKVLIPGFYDNVRPVTTAEEKLYDPIIDWLKKSTCGGETNARSQHSTITSPTQISRVVKKEYLNVTDEGKCTEMIKNELMARWRYPTMTVHKIDVSMNNPTIIPRCAKAAVSMRVVPDQDISQICQLFEEYVHNAFAATGSENDIKIDIQSASEYWLGNPDNEYFKAVERAIEHEWNIKPLYIREGGSIPAVRWLEKFCNAPAVHLPMGQASDQAHLHNERIRLRNLQAGRHIVKHLLRHLPRPTNTC